MSLRHVVDNPEAIFHRGNVIKTGELTKKSRGNSLFGNWKRRKFVLIPTKLTYSVINGPEKGFITITKDTTVTILQFSIENKKHLLKVLNEEDDDIPAEELIMSADNEADQKEWVHMIQSCITRLRNQHRAETSKRQLMSDKERREADKKTRIKDKSLRYRPLTVEPVACNKKLSTEMTYRSRVCWIDPESLEFKWAKSIKPVDVAKAKGIHIKTCIKRIILNNCPRLSQPNFSIELFKVAPVADGVFNKKFMRKNAMVSKDVVCTIDIGSIDDPDVCLEMIAYLNELIVE